MINIFKLCTEVIIEHIFVGFIQNMVVFIKKSNKKLFPHHAIIEHRAMFRTERGNGIAKPAQWRQVLQSMPLKFIY